MKTSAPGFPNRTASISPSYRKAAGIAVAIQVFVVFWSGLILDGGGICQLCVMALPPFWAATAVLVWRRPRQSTRFDLSFVRVGYLPVVAITLFLAPFIWHLRGVL